jgi:hypothetical protein
MGKNRREQLRFGFEFLQQYHKDGDKFLNHIAWVVGDETMVQFLNVQTKEESKKLMHTRSPNHSKRV